MPVASTSLPTLLDHRLRIEAARYVLGALSSDELRDLATEALLRGTDSRSLALLAGAPRCDHPADLRALFEAGLREAGIKLPRRLEAAERLKRHYAGQVAAGRLAPLTGAHAIIDVYWQIGDELPATKAFVGDEFGIATLYGLFWALDELPVGDSAYAALEAKLVAACGVIAAGRRA
ncbi:MAG TPA: hypothetical protein VFS43_44530 [Polyangiaceae bacterium]|nr:hypothetical protein [Polyangiaceae bacterium]